MLGFQSPALELELARSVRSADYAAAERYRLGKLARRHADVKSTGGVVLPTRPVRPVAGGVGAPRGSSG
jgi:hypothetical protein